MRWRSACRGLGKRAGGVVWRMLAESGEFLERQEGDVRFYKMAEVGEQGLTDFPDVN